MLVISPDLCYISVILLQYTGIWCCCPLFLFLFIIIIIIIIIIYFFISFFSCICITISSNYFFYTGDQFIEPYGFSGSLPLLFAMLFAIFDLIAENKLLVGWLLQSTL